jgi:hypothetical protein
MFAASQALKLPLKLTKLGYSLASCEAAMVERPPTWQACYTQKKRRMIQTVTVKLPPDLRGSNLGRGSNLLKIR